MKNSELPAFPKPHTNSDGSVQHDVYNGLTKREYFAGLAMQSIITMPYYENIEDKIIVADSVAIADELLKQLEA